ncbi:hypothetical protein BLNAU_7065 [Blattamonas nauphoetae]|uniref:Uncharacterized protein n=1 Tax=Blattamonas nauphoetae TaxID=2049346 RepID=A0ABQ9Y2F5_9EUKA|nr:hypothetical protein BLNAU_7065 [Blattamonas nauphoetae]
MECSGFVLADWDRSGSSRIVIVGSSHKSSTRNIVLPLVGRGYGQLSKNNEEWMGDEEGWSDGLVEMEEIIGVGLSFDSTHFALGTGPLFSFTGKSLFGSEIEVIGEISTELGSSDILNVTSTVRDGNGKKLRDGSCVWERVVGSRISGSTNHDMGTGLCGAQFGFNVVCVNSSFSSCVRTSNTEIDMKHENITDSHIGRTEVRSSVVTSVQFTLCTFNNMTITDTYSRGGSAICLNQSQSTLTINQCFFHNCTSLPVLNDGGAVRANRDDGALFLEGHSLATLSNCAFVQCFTSGYGGAMEVFKVKSIDFSFLQFRGCFSGDSKSKDIYFDGVETSLPTELTVRFCDSTSGIPNVFLHNYTPKGVNRSHLVPQMHDPTVTVEVSVSFDADNATVTATASEAVKGAMGILLNGSNVPRLVHVEFGTSYSSSKTGTAVVSSGVDGILPIENYQLRSFSVSGSRLLPESEPAAFEASLEWTDDRCVEMVLKLMGQQLPADSTSDFIVTIASSSVTFVVTFINNNSGQSDPFFVTPSFSLEWEQEYRILSIEEDVPSDPQRIFCLNPMFTVPTPPHLTSARMECATSLCTSMRIVFEGEKLSPGVPFITKFSDTPLTLTTTFTSPTSGQTEPIDVSSSNPFPLSGFTIVSMEEKNANPPRWVDVDRIPTIVHEAMITGVNCTLDNTATTYIIQFFSIFVISSDLEMELQDDASNTLQLHAFLTDGVLTATEVMYPTSPNNLIAGRTYTVVSSNNATIKIRPSLNFTTPLPPKVLSASAECANVMCTTINIVLRGQALLTNRTFLLFLDGIEEPMQFSCETQTIATIGPVRIGGGLALKHSTTYTLLSIVEDTATDTHRIHCEDVTFTTPSSPPLSTVHVSSGNGEDWLDWGTRTFDHVTMWEISFSSLEIARNAVVSEAQHPATHTTVRVGEEGGLVVDGATETSLDSLSFVLPSLSAVEVYAEIKTDTLHSSELGMG